MTAIGFVEFADFRRKYPIQCGLRLRMRSSFIVDNTVDIDTRNWNDPAKRALARASSNDEASVIT